MTALDTNVLIRYLVGDVPEQAEAARALIHELTPTILVSYAARSSWRLPGCWSEATDSRDPRLLKY